MMLDPQYTPLIIAIGVALVVIMLGFAFLGASRDAPKIDHRLRRGDDLRPEAPRGSTRRQASLRRDEEAQGVWGALRRVLPNPDKLRSRLEMTGRKISLNEFLLYSVATALFFAIILKVLTTAPVAVAAMGGLLMGLVLPNQVIKFMANRRINTFMKSFPDAIEMIVRGLRSGLPFIESVNAVGKEFPDPIGIEFRRVSDAVRLGQSVESAMWDVAERIDAPEFKFLIVAMTIQRETGGNLAETLGNLSELLRKRKALKLKIRALSSEARASAYIIGALPFVMFFIINIVNHEYAKMLWTEERGIHMLYWGFGLMFTGYYSMYRMVNFEV